MSGEAEKCQLSKSGTYSLQITQVNGHPYWTNTSGKNSIWFDFLYGNWSVGDVIDIGGTICGIQGPKNVDEWPTNIASKWQFYGGGKWQEAAGEDIIFEDCTPSVAAKVTEQALVSSRKMFNLFKSKK